MPVLNSSCCYLKLSLFVPSTTQRQLISFTTARAGQTMQLNYKAGPQSTAPNFDLSHLLNHLTRAALLILEGLPTRNCCCERPHLALCFKLFSSDLLLPFQTAVHFFSFVRGVLTVPLYCVLLLCTIAFVRISR